MCGVVGENLHPLNVSFAKHQCLRPSNCMHVRDGLGECNRRANLARHRQIEHMPAAMFGKIERTGCGIAREQIQIDIDRRIAQRIAQAAVARALALGFLSLVKHGARRGHNNAKT